MAIEIKRVEHNKKEFLPLLLLADEQEDMIDRYLERGMMFALYDSGAVRAVCVATDEGCGVCELKNLAVEPRRQKQGYGRALVEYVCGLFGRTHDVMTVGTGAGTGAEEFYKKCGFRFSHLVKDFFTEHYVHEMVEDGVALRDMAYFERKLRRETALRPLEDGDVPLIAEWLRKDHVKRWFEHPEEWLREIAERQGEFSFLRHFIVEWKGKPVGFCQYYACADAVEDWYGDVPMEGTYSIDYLIGEVDLLGCGLGKETVALLVARVFAREGALRVIARPDEENAASRGVLLANGFWYDAGNDLFCKQNNRPRREE